MPNSAFKNIPTDVDSYIKDIASILKISVPPIKMVGLIYDQGEQRCAVNNPDIRTLPEDVYFLSAFFFDEENSIYVSENFVHIDSDLRKCDIKTTAEHVYTIAHELRHVWQKTYYKNKFYQKDAFGTEVVNDIAEIDADAFAIAYVFSNKTFFTPQSMPSMMNEVAFQCFLDKGERWKKSRELSNYYKFGGISKIDDAENAIDKQSIIEFLGF